MTRRDVPWPGGTPCWIDLLTPDDADARDFYTALFGWTWSTESMVGVEYSTATLDGAAVCGLIPARDGHPPVWNTYLASADLDTTAAAIGAAGGRLVDPVTVAGARGRFLVAEDGTGAIVCAWEAAGHVGCEIVNEPGAFVWTELMTRDVAAAKAWYAAAFGVGFTDIGDGTFTFATMSVDGNVVGGMGSMPDEFPAEVPPHWRLYFAAADTDTVMAKAVELGGALVVEAHDTPFGRWGTVTDRQGARFSVITPPAG